MSSNLGSKIKTILENKNSNLEEINESISKNRMNFINSAVCVEYGLEHLAVALQQDFKSKELKDIKKDFIELNRKYLMMRNKLNRFIKIKDMEEELFNIKDMFQLCLDEIQNGNVRFVDENQMKILDKEVNKTKRVKKEKSE
jgi:hypothetical protein